ncbi:MAG: hypothetical protein F4Y80_01120 [Caldilineaceae bacterium SB0665_bin_21]|nr:hypothetical protein [Caldilineaceae bacterium SB0665_bin_21]
MNLEIGKNRDRLSWTGYSITHRSNEHLVYRFPHGTPRAVVVDRILFSVQQEVEEQGYPNPSDYVQQAARTLLQETVGIFSGHIDADPTSDGEILIEAIVPHVDGASMLFLCGPSDRVICVVDMNGHYRHERFHGTDYVSNPFIWQALSDLQSAFLHQVFTELKTESAGWHESYYRPTNRSDDQPVHVAWAQIVQ